MKRRLLACALSMTCLLGMARAAPAGHAYDAHSGGTLVIGRITTDPQKDYERFRHLADYIAGELGALGYTRGEVVFAGSLPEMVSLMRAGKVDLVPESLYPAAVLATEAGAKVTLREWRDGIGSYSTVVFTRKDSGIDDLTDLVGRTVAFEDAGSTSSYFMPKAALVDAGLATAELSKPDEPAPSDAVGYVFAREETNIVAWVHKGWVQAGAINDVDWETDEDDVPPALKKDLKILHKSEPYPRGVIAMRGDLPAAVQAQITAVLLAASKDPKGKVALDDYRGVTQYDLLPADEVENFIRLQEMLARH